MSEHKDFRLQDWVKDAMQPVLGFRDDDVASYVLSMANGTDLLPYLQQFFQTRSAAIEFCDRLKRKQQELARSGGKTASNASYPALVTSSDRPSSSHAKDIATRLNLSQSNMKITYKTSKRPKRKKEVPKKTANKDQKTANKTRSKGYGRNSGVSYGKHRGGANVGWHERGKVLTNCLSCGKIIFEIDGLGPCSFCGERLDIDAIGLQPAAGKTAPEKSKRGKKGKKGFSSRLDRQNAHANAEVLRLQEAHKRAVANKERLLRFDRTQAARSQVYDDQHDYFNANSAWLSEKERHKTAALDTQRRDKVKRHGRLRALNIDFAGRVVVDREGDSDEERAANDSKSSAADGYSGPSSASMFQGKDKPGDFANPTLSGRVARLYKYIHGQMDTPPPKKEATKPGGGTGKLGSRLQHLEDGSNPAEQGKEAPVAAPPSSSSSSSSGQLWSSRDKCLVVDQPLASLLVHGFKRFEGREWSTDFRGNLWIASSKHAPTKDYVLATEMGYANLVSDETRPPFPTKYPRGRLLGRVTLSTCLSQQEYREQVIDATSPLENKCPFLFLCSEPHRLSKTLKLPPPLLARKDELWSMGVLPPSPPAGTQLSAVDVSFQNHSALVADHRRRSQLQRELRFDICPPSKSRPVPSQPKPHVAGHGRALAPGLVLLPKFLSIASQQQVIDTVRELGVGSAGFFVPSFPNGAKMKLKMMCMGWHWNNVSNAYESKRSNYDEQLVPPIPATLLQIAEQALMSALCVDRAILGTGQEDLTVPDICLANFYSGPQSQLGVHQDKSESHESLKRGLPVISFSIGDTADFYYSMHRPKLSQKQRLTDPTAALASMTKVTLRSGDAIIFGGPSRMIYHALHGVAPRSAPPQLHLAPGRLNLTLRKM